MKQYRYSLEKYKGKRTRHTCPNCNKQGVFVRYIDTETGEYVADVVGRCNREIECSYHLKPFQYFADNPQIVPSDKPFPFLPSKVKKLETQKPISSIPLEKYNGSLKNYDKNSFVCYLIRLFGVNLTKSLIEKYFIGSSKCWDGATTFPQIDISGQLRQIKVMDYNPETGKRRKSADVSFRWSESQKKYFKDVNRGDKIFFAGRKIIGNADAHFLLCFFGEHLLREPHKPVALVESEKTAIIASMYLPDFIWLATGGLHGCKWSDKAIYNVLRGRDVVLFPDLNGFNTWQMKFKGLATVARSISFSTLLEEKAGEQERKEGLDIADYLTRFDYRVFEKNRSVVKSTT